MGRSCRRVILLLAVVLFFAYSTIALADDPEPLALSVSSARETCTLGSVTTLDYTIDGGVPPYQVTVDGRAIEQSSSPDYVPCRPSAFWSPLEELGGDSTQRISVRVSDSAGDRAYAIAELQLVPPPPVPTRLRLTSGVDRQSATDLTAEWTLPYLAREQRTGKVAIRWRLKGDDDWTVEHHSATTITAYSYRVWWTSEASPHGEHREVQVAQIRHNHDLQVPEALVWSPTVLVTTAAPPYRLQVEATHDSITLSWGPHAPGLEYVAKLNAVRPDQYRSQKQLHVTTGPLYEAKFNDLLPDTLYRVEVYLDRANRYGYRHTLDQHLFEMRTDAAPVGWSSSSRTPTDISATVIDGELEVTWTPADTGSRHETSVCARPSEYLWGGYCVTVPPGQDGARLPLHQLGAGGTFLIRVETLTAPPGTGEVEVQLPSYDPALPTRGAPAAAPQLFELSWSHHPENPTPGSWRFHWDYQDTELAEFSWREDGRTIIREVRGGDFPYHAERGFRIGSEYGQAPEAVRVRLLRDGAWTPWSASADVPDVRGVIGNLRFGEQQDTLEIRWDRPQYGDEVLVYQVHVQRNEGTEEVIDAGLQTSVEIRMRSDDEEYRVEVGAFTQDRRPVGRIHRGRYVRGPLSLGVSARYSPCPSLEQAPLEVYWYITNGAPPFTLSIGDEAGFETEQRYGFSVVECRATTDGTMQEIQAWVTDAGGQTAVDTLKVHDLRFGEPEQSVDLHAVRLGLRSVHRDRVFLSRVCRLWPYETALRWRLPGQVGWTYLTNFTQRRDVDERCRGTWDGLEPSTTYEYQLARYERPIQLRYPERLQWNETQAVTTLGPAQLPVIERSEETVAVKWQRQPEARAYLVGLRAEGRSWWKRYDPSGEATETVYFYRIPRDLSLRLELISPPLENGAEPRTKGYDISSAYLHE